MLYAVHLVVRKGRCALRFTLPAALISVLAVSRMLLLCTPSFALSEGDVEAVCAVVVQDSTVSRWNRRAVVSLRECFASGGVSASARGVVSAGYPDGVVLLAGDTVLLVGGMDEYGFDADECIVLERGVASRSRNRLMERGRSLIAGDGGLEGELSMMLLLGCTDMPDFPLTDLARSSGTSIQEVNSLLKKFKEIKRTIEIVGNMDKNQLKGIMNQLGNVKNSDFDF